MGVIYKITNLINGKSYIGQTNNFQRRMREHQNTKDNYAIHLAIQKYGKDAFSYEIIEHCNDDILDEREIYWINFYKTHITEKGYNMTFGGDNADALNRWRKENPNLAKEYALQNLEKANEYHKNHREEHLAQLASVRQKGIDKIKRKVKCVELDIVFDSLADAERWSQSNLNPNGKKASHQHIAHVCRGHRKTCGGYHWIYI